MNPAALMPTAEMLLTSRRHALLGLLTAGFLAGCASRPTEPGAAGAPAAATRSPAPRVDSGRYALRRPSSGRISGAPTGHGQGIRVKREAVVATALMLINTPYKWGGNSPEGGFDCSGLVHYVFNQVMGNERPLPRTTAAWADATTPIGDALRQRGDLVFFNTMGRPFSHMGILIDDEVFVHAPSSGGKVRKTALSNSYFAKRYLGARRVFPA